MASGGNKALRVEVVMYSHVHQVKAIDVHAHYGTYHRGVSKLTDAFSSADAKLVEDRARLVNIEWSIVSPLRSLLPRFEANAHEGNDEAVQAVSVTSGLLQWVVVNPLQKETYTQASKLLKSPKCVGIKIHPEEHGYPIKEWGAEIFEFAAGHKTVVLTHSGEMNSLPADFVNFANQFPEVRLILAHLGCGWDDDPSHQVRAIQQSRNRNMFVDTSSARSILPNLIEWAVGEVGADRILFGSDSPLYSVAMQRARIDYAEIGEADKKLILRENAESLLIGRER